MITISYDSYWYHWHAISHDVILIASVPKCIVHFTDWLDEKEIEYEIDFDIHDCSIYEIELSEELYAEYLREIKKL